jgi:uncharacterized protein YdaU (DUF1376 family)
MAETWQQWYPHKIDKWMGSANVMELTPAGYKAFHCLIQAQFQSEDGMLPANDRELAKLSRVKAHWAEIREEVMELFETAGDRIYNSVMLREWHRAREVHIKRLESAKRGGRKPDGNRTETERKPNGNRTETERQPNAHTVTEQNRTEQKEKGASPPQSAPGRSYEADELPDGLPAMHYGLALLDRLDMVADLVPIQLKQAAGGAVANYAKSQQIRPAKAVERLIPLARAAIAEGVKLKFWLEDCGWENHGKTQRNGASARVGKSISAIEAAVAKRVGRAAGDAPGADDGGLSPPRAGSGAGDVLGGVGADRDGARHSEAARGSPGHPVGVEVVSPSQRTGGGL